MITMTVMLNYWIWENMYAPERWREEIVENLFKNGDKAIKLPRDNAIKNHMRNIL